MSRGINNNEFINNKFSIKEVLFFKSNKHLIKSMVNSLYVEVDLKYKNRNAKKNRIFDSYLTMRFFRGCDEMDSIENVCFLRYTIVVIHDHCYHLWSNQIDR